MYLKDYKEGVELRKNDSRNKEEKMNEYLRKERKM